MDTTEGTGIASGGSQSKLPVALLLLLVAALIFRIVTAVTDRGSATPKAAAGEPPPLVRWVPLEKAAAVAKTTGKPLLYDFTAEWCPPCHRLDEEGWGDRELAKSASEGFVAVRVMDRSREDGRNPPLVDELQRLYGVEAFPTLIVAGPDGKAIAREEGWGGPDNLRKFLEDSKAKAAAPAAAAVPADP